MTTARMPSGRDIWKAVREELALNLYALPFSTLAPTVYHVYLHPEDFQAIEGIVGTVTDQIRQALTEEVARLNRDMGSRVKTIMARLLEREALAPIAVPPAGWEVHIRRDPDDELARGQIGIVSTLAMPAPVEYAGTPTTRIVRSVVGERGRTATVTHVPVEPRPVAGPSVATPPEMRRETEARSGHERARLTYVDDQGAHEFIIRKDVVSIGRGGSAVWVDVQIITTAKVSREHVRIRLDASGECFVQDVSLWGTTVNGMPIAPAVKGPEGVAQPGPECPLPSPATITLAGAISLEFTTVGAR
ncbi:FHA domain-containing protein [Luteitalea sp.]|uniref:FHA domain-containing protein n=1 Tax=Luteitalea sp. TaxID=2004800 RepID=UPI0025BE38C0|nr:FHA domain-containing protein [Luteitalea sp.]